MSPSKSQNSFESLSLRGMDHTSTKHGSCDTPHRREDAGNFESLPAHMSNVPVSNLAVDKGTIGALAQQGCHMLGDLSASNIEGVLSRARLAKLITLIDFLRNVPLEKLEQMGWEEEPGRLRVPRLSAELLDAIASAKTLDEEVQALCTGLSDRNRCLLLARLRYRADRRPTLDELGESIGVTRERVRQIVTGRMKALVESGLRLPIGSRVAQEIDLAGEAISPAQLAVRLAGDAIIKDELSLCPLGELSDAGLVPKIKWIPEVGAWIGMNGYAAWIESGRDSVLGTLKRFAGKELRRVGAVRESALEELSPFGPGRAAALVAPAGGKFGRVLGHLVRVPPTNSTLIRQAQKVLTVTSPVAIFDLHSGLQRYPRLSPVPPRDVVEFILERHAGFEVDQGRARMSSQLRRSQVLSKSERALVEVLEENDDVALLQDIVDGIKKRGFSVAMASVLTRSPILTRVSTAVYALRGRRVPTALVTERRKRWLDSRSTNVVTSGWEGPHRFVVTYRLSRFNLNGVFSVPSAFLVRLENWRGKLPTGEVVKVTMRDHSLWGVGRWLSQAGANVGDHLVVTIDPDTAVIEFDLIES